MGCSSILMLPFVPHPFLKNPHIMTLFPRYWPRPGLLKKIPSEERLFQIDHASRILTICNWQRNPTESPTLVLVHGLEGCTESHYMQGIAHKAWEAGLNVLRMNQRNCGGTEHLTPTLYHNGLSQDICAIISELVTTDGLQAIWAAGYSMGGNLVLRMAGQARNTLSPLKGVAAICPNIHPAACVKALERRGNILYHTYFLTRLKARLKRKAKHFPGAFDLSHLSRIKTMWEFDEAYTAPYSGFSHATNYYEQTGARHLLQDIQIPTLIITAQNDPFIPFGNFDIEPVHHNPWIRFHAPTHGGHCAFIQHPRQEEDMYWAENRIVEFVTQASHQD